MNLGMERCRNKPSGKCLCFIFDIEPAVQNLVVHSATDKCRFREFAHMENSASRKFFVCVWPLCVCVYFCVELGSVSAGTSSLPNSSHCSAF